MAAATTAATISAGGSAEGFRAPPTAYLVARGGQPLPYRLDQHLNIGIKRGEKAPTGIFGRMLDAIDGRFFSWPWKSFVNRRPLNGPKQFIRVSTPILENDPKSADKLLVDFLPRWLVAADYRQELGHWRH